MGCSTSKLDNEEVVQLCKDRKEFIKQAVEHRRRFAYGHIAYIQSMKKVSAALRDYSEGDEPRSSCGNPSVSVEEQPQSPETVRIETYSPVNQYGMDGYFGMQSSPMNFFHYSPNNRPNFPPSSPQTSQWDFFWNPFSSLDYYGYPNRSSMDQTILDDEINGLRQVREEEGIPELEEETEQEETDNRVNRTEGRAKVEVNCTREEVTVEDVDDDDDDDEDGCEDADSGNDTEHEVKGFQCHGSQSMEVSNAQKIAQVSNQETAVGDRQANEETPGFTVYVKRRPTSMAEVIKDLEAQFAIVCKSADEVSAMLEASRAQYTSTSTELSGSITQAK
ncbi:unnamed protein product [Ilex paraguariensis]|uniref:DUF630 domain-containing protein n=1 Tax=Ilex paraguariensis TaxID=185542 RepID=A0ABC8SUL9_9AQUA